MPRLFHLACILLCAAYLTGRTEGGDLSPPLMRDFMGLNGHTVQFRPEVYSAAGKLVRDYHPVAWDLSESTGVLPHFPEAKNGVNWETVYGLWKKEGYRIDVCLMFESIKREAWLEPEKNIRAYGRAFAEEFGPSGSRRLVDSVEIGNEPGDWSDDDYRKMFSAMAEGLREGDSGLLVASCALVAGPSQKYAKSADCLRGLEKECDVLTIHTYAQLQGWPTWKRSYPEDPALPDYLKDVENLCSWRDQHAAGKPVWITEFGYDSSTKTPVQKDAFSRWEGVNDEQQAQWIVRSYLIFSAMPVERAYLYFFNDNDEPKLHGSAGLTRNFLPKPSYFAVAHLYRTLGDYRFSKVIKNGSECRIQEYRSASQPLQIIWAAWSPTGAGIKREIILENTPGLLRRAESMPLDGVLSRTPETAGVREVGKGKLAVPISETPIYLFFGPLAN